MAGSLTSRAAHGIEDALMALKATPGLFQLDGAASAVTLDDTYPAIWKYDPTGAHRDITLDAIATSSGLYRRIINAADAAENLVCKNVAGDTIATINQNEQGEFYCNGTTWALIAITTIALS